MIDLLSADQNAPFTIALIVMVGMAVLEVVSLLLGVGLSQAIDSMVPDIDVDIDVDLDVDADLDADLDVDADIGATADSGGFLIPLLGWLRVGQVPLLMLLVVFLTAFGLIGLAMQSLLVSTAGFLAPASVAWILPFALSLPVLNVVGGLLARAIPKEETSAVSRESFVGRVAEIVLGEASAGNPTQARLTDEHGRTHYIQVEPANTAETFAAGERVLVVEALPARFRVIAVPGDYLVDASQ